MWGAPSGAFTTTSAAGGHSCGIRSDGTAVCWDSNGDPRPISLGPGLGTPCAPNTPTCRYLHIQLRGFDPDTYTVTCSHDGWSNIPAGTWRTFTATVGAERSDTITRQWLINFASLTGNGVYVTVTRPGTSAVTSNHLK